MENTEQQTNRHFLPDGRSFIIDVSKESPEAWATKKAFIISIGEHELAHNKMFSAAVLRLLATGMIAVTENGKRKAKAELLAGFTALIAEAREMGALRYEALMSKMKDGGYSSDKLDMMLSALSGDALVDSIEATLKGNGYADSSIVKTYLPDIYKAIQAYDKENSEDTIRLLKHRFSPMTKAVNATDNAIVVTNSHNVRPVYLEPITAYLDGIEIETAGWKQLSVFLILATGRRMAEIHGTATAFTFIDNDHVMFEGQLKTKGREEGAKPYAIRTFADASRVVLAFERLCSLRPPLSPEAVNRKLSKPLSSEMPADIKAFYQHANITQYKDMRDVYAARMLEYKPVTMTANAFVAGCMGHGSEDISTANTYQKIRIASLSNEDAL
jgi:hypothetical protein